MKKVFIILASLLLTTSVMAQITEEPSGKLSGVFYVDYYFNAVRDTGFHALPNKALNGVQDVHGLQIRRIYLTYDYRFNSKFSSRFRLESDEANFTTDVKGEKAGKFGVFVKDAWIRWNYTKSHEVIVGIQPTPAFEVSEMVWENRYIEKTILDLRKVVPSRDLAISFKGKIDPQGMFKYWLMYGNNQAGLPESDKYKRYFGQVEANINKNFYFTAYADYQEKKKLTSAFNSNEELSNNKMTYAFFAGYRKKEVFSGGVEVYTGTTQNDYPLFADSSYTNSNGLGISIFATYYIKQNLNVFGRYDVFEPNSHTLATSDKRNLVIAGIAFKPVEKLIISPNVFIEMYENIGNREVKSSITPRLTASWAF